MRQLERQWQKSSPINTEPDFQKPRGKYKLRELAKYKKDKQANFARRCQRSKIFCIASQIQPLRKL